MFKNYKLYCQKLKISFKKDLILTIMIASLIFIVSILLFFLYSSYLGILGIAISLSYVYSHYSSLKGRVKQLITAKEIAFNAFFRYIITLLGNGEILYSSLQASLEYIDEVLIDDVNELIAEIENDTSLDPFIKFSENFNDESIKQLVILLYKTQESGAMEDVLDSINKCIVNLQDTSIESYVLKEEKTIEKYSFFPIILSALVMIIITFYVFSLIGSGDYV